MEQHNDTKPDAVTNPPFGLGAFYGQKQAMDSHQQGEPALRGRQRPHRPYTYAPNKFALLQERYR